MLGFLVQYCLVLQKNEKAFSRQHGQHDTDNNF
jgi:hypothetical protein